MFLAIWQSFRRMPGWVQIWVALWLAPINIISLAFIGVDGAISAGLVAALALFGMAPNLPIMMVQRGLGKTMAIPHVLIWTPLVFLVWGLLSNPDVVGAYRAYLWALLITNAISLAFDYKDTVDWFRGDRGVA